MTDVCTPRDIIFEISNYGPPVLRLKGTRDGERETAQLAVMIKIPERDCSLVKTPISKAIQSEGIPLRLLFSGLPLRSAWIVNDQKEC